MQGTIAARLLLGLCAGSAAALVAAGCERGSGGRSVASVPAAERVDFARDVLPLFTTPNVWAENTLACDNAACHTPSNFANGKASHELDMGTYAGVLLGADAGDEPIIVRGDGAGSSLRARLRNNRMPPGILPNWAETGIPTPTGVPEGVPRNGPLLPTPANLYSTDLNAVAATSLRVVEIVTAWIDAGAPDGPFNLTKSATTYRFDFDANVLPLFTKDNVFFPGSIACNATGCHFSNVAGSGSAHELDMGSYAGIIAGADGGAEPIVLKGNSGESPLRKRLRNNRMPWTIPSTVPRNGPSNQVQTVIDWIDQGAFEAKNPTMTVTFSTDVLPLFTENNAFYPGSLACNATGCHTGVGGAHDLDMGSYDGILLGADAGEEPILLAANSGESPLRKRLRNNRMPWGILTTVPRNGPAGEVKLVEDWINAGAPDGAFEARVGTGTAVRTFTADVLPLFTTANRWAPGTPACNDAACHTPSNFANDKASHELDMGTYAGIILGADAGDEPIVVKGNAAESSLRARLRNNRMPFAILPNWAETGITRTASVPEGVPRNGTGGEVKKVATWIDEGARYDNGNFKVAFPPAPASSGGSGGSGGGATVSFARTILPVFQGNCSCHVSGQSSGGLKLDGYEQVLSGNPSLSPVPSSSNGPAVLPGNGGGSLLYLKVASSSPPIGARMPLNAAALSAADQEAIRAWIDAGAPNN